MLNLDHDELIEILKSNGITDIKKTGDWIMTRCLFHDENNPSFGINIHSGCYNCFACGVSGSFNELVDKKGLIVSVDELDIPNKNKIKKILSLNRSKNNPKFNFVNLFDKRTYLSDPSNQNLFTVPEYPTTFGDDHVYNKQTLGFRVDTRDEIAAGKKAWLSPPKKIDDVVDYLGALLGFMMDIANKAHLHDNDWHRTVFIDALGVKATDFSLSNETVEALFNSGETGTRAYFSWFEDQGEKPKNRV